MIDLTELTGEIKAESREEFLETLTKILARMGDPFQMPDAMSQWLNEYTAATGVDSYYQVPIGYGSAPLSVRFMFKKSMILMEFVDAFGMRLMELRLHT